MADYQDEFKRILDEEVGSYAAKALQLLAAAVQAKGLVLTEELLNSLRTEVVGATAQHVAVMGVLFEQYGRIKDMKGLNRTKAPPIEEIEAYVKKVGLSHFDYIPGYTDRSKVSPVSSRAINRIAWGIARAKLRDNAQVRPKSWFSKTFYKSINGFIDAVTTRYKAATGTHLAATLKV
ncbi:hypothetical protein GO988_05755 [Hymenobacter sp. HMF4947]|uniref:Uncharacterized protein n=1 Tax=Hymenobacter ginkgonis TaxID=2682976 RepID=A0A7K1TBP4_9BACT|nr:hypothetical protein [Hymenobacter ginkgonis]MVN75826.1 hypothetical protein [Hymenobacter ginkgonis]